MGRRSQIVGVLRAAGRALDDDEIAQRLGINRHYVNTVCRKLAADHEISRAPGAAGKVVNLLNADGGRRNIESAVPGRSTERKPRREWTRRQQRARENVNALVATFGECVEHFEESNAFSGPSLYFHQRAIQIRRRHNTVQTLLADDRFLEYVYAVLPAWGMHRMGRQAAKVGDFHEMVDSIRAVASSIEQLWPLQITDVAPTDEESVTARVWDVISSLRVSTSGTRIVAGSKALHHVLPSLVPPIDRQYTFQFFTGQKMTAIGEERAFGEWFPLLCELGRTRRVDIEASIRRGGFMATGPAKVIDNAIIGYMQRSGASVEVT